jgi:hypothetical protein
VGARENCASTQCHHVWGITPGSSGTRARPLIEPRAEAANNAVLGAAESLRLHWPEYLMEAGEAGLYLLSACVVATFFWHPASPVQRYLTSEAVRRILMGLALGATVIGIVLSPWCKQSGAHSTPRSRSLSID